MGKKENIQKIRKLQNTQKIQNMNYGTYINNKIKNLKLFDFSKMLDLSTCILVFLVYFVQYVVIFNAIIRSIAFSVYRNQF